MYYSEFYRFLKRWRQAKRLPPKTAWPPQIFLDDQAWEAVRRLYNFTSLDNNEYETAFFYVGGETFTTGAVRGSNQSVSASHKIQVNFTIDQKFKQYYSTVEVDGNIISKKPIEPSTISAHSEIGFLFNLHTHPLHVNQQGKNTYSFFSSQDVATLLNGDNICAGLITDSLWLICKTDDSLATLGEVGEEVLQQISSSAFAGEEYLEKLIKSQMDNWGLVFYRAKFQEPLTKVN